uniref:Variant surface glycoprotein 689 n=1 Tax=Trypanosoma brucei TaxID=5691 RepID=M4T2B5_9TRYP|nr:variant surface glycoprotein 689 [Trypanosoma brucei]
MLNDSICKVFIVVLAATAVTRPGSAALAGAMNKREFHTICEIARLAGATINILEEPPALPPSYSKLLKLNMTVAPEAWRQIFRDQQAKGKYLDAPPTTIPNGPDWKESWSLWKAAAEAADKGADDDDIKKANFEDVPERTKQLLRAHMTNIARKAQQLVASITKPIQGSKELTGPAIQAAISEAVYGETPKPGTITVAKLFGPTAASTDPRTTLCTIGSGVKQAKTLAALLACLCIEEQTSGLAQACTHAQPTGEQWQGGTALPTANHIKNVLDLCGYAKKATLTADSIAAKLENIKKLIQVKSTNGVIGEYISACSGAAAAGVCATIPNYNTDNTAAFEAIPWVASLRSLENKLRDRETRKAKMETIEKKLESELAQTGGLRQQIEATIASGKQVTDTDAAPTKFNSATEDCNKHTTNETCITNKCKWDSTIATTGKHCKPKTGTENTATGTGNGGGEEHAAIKAGCATHKDKTACENDKRGDKHNCAWRKGKDNEPDLEKVMCRNGSFNVNFKFSLVTPAT